MLDERAFELLPDRSMAPLLLGLVPPVYRRAERFANHARS